jgi:membrane-bound lytic murein transglycosylase D
MKTTLIPSLIIFYLAALLSNSDLFSNKALPAEDIFHTPDNLKENVLFWKKIYTDVSGNEGLIHDRENPQIIYKKIYIGDSRGAFRRNTLKKSFNEIQVMLKNIQKNPSATWSEAEQQIYTQYKNAGIVNQIPDAAERIRFQQGLKEQYKLGLERSGAYLPFILETFAKYGIPLRIAYLPHVESSFNIEAYSRVGAAGMWQFMSYTGKLFMKVDYKIDERRDPFKSTIAAAKLLRKNYETVQSWPLAITAYNHGLASICRAVSQTGCRDLGVIIDQYKNHRFRFASKNFYGCFIAASEIAMNAADYFTDINYHPPLLFKEIELDSNLPPKILAKNLGLSMEELKQMNPAIRPVVFKKNLPIPKTYKLHIPIHHDISKAKQALAAIPKEIKQFAGKDYFYHTVKKGETLFAISKKYGISTDIILAGNEIEANYRIYIGQILRIPSSLTISSHPASQEKIASTSHTKVDQTIIKKVEKAEAKELPKLGQQSGEKLDETFDASLYNLDIIINPAKKTGVLTVSLNETLGHLAEWLNVPIQRLRSMNRLKRQTIRVNQKVQIPVSGNLDDFNQKRLEFHMAIEEDFYSQYQIIGTKEKKIRQGENLWSICKDDEIPVWLLKKYNRNIDFNTLSIKSFITIPVIEPRQSR